MNRHRLSHSEISGSMPACGCPELIAAYHVLHRLLVPRHPLHALTILHCAMNDFQIGTALAAPEIHCACFIFCVFMPRGIKNCSINFVFYPVCSCQRTWTCENNAYEERVVGRTGLEPVTPALSRRCSNQLSYMPGNPSTYHLELVEVRRLELLTSSLQS